MKKHVILVILLLYQHLLPKNFSFLIQIQKTKTRRRKIIKKPNTITITSVNFAYIVIIIEAACQFLKYILILGELVK